MVPTTPRLIEIRVMPGGSGKNSFSWAGHGSQNAEFWSVASAYNGLSNQTLPGKGKTKGEDDHCSWMPCSRVSRQRSSWPGRDGSRHWGYLWNRQLCWLTTYERPISRRHRREMLAAAFKRSVRWPESKERDNRGQQFSAGNEVVWGTIRVPGRRKNPWLSSVRRDMIRIT
jgi:hypothetical protein